MAYPKKTATEIIEAFELQVDDVTELSTSEELEILNRVYVRICASKPWEFLKTNATGTILQDATSYYITLPDNFMFMSENKNYTDNTTAYQNNANAKVVFIGTTYQPYQVVNFSDRRQYINQTGVCYLSLSENKIRFMATPVATTYDFDYVAKPALLVAADYPAFPGQFHDMLAYAMAIENDILQLSPKATSYQDKNEEKFKEDLLAMQYWNALQIND